MNTTLNTGLPRGNAEREKCPALIVASRLTLLALLLALPAAAQPPAKPPTPLPPNDTQTQMFRGLFHFRKVKPETLAATQQREYDYRNLIVVIHGNPGVDAKWAAVCKATLNGGGAVLISADTLLSLDAYFPRKGTAGVVGLRVKSYRAQEQDGGDPDRVIVQPTEAADGTPFAGLSRVATDGPSYLQFPAVPAGLGLKVMAEFPDGSRRVVGQADLALGDTMVFAYATADDTRTDKCMVLADPEVFSNKMIFLSGRERDEERTDNLKFADATVKWLQAGWRTKCLFIENGNEQTRFDEFEYASITLPLPNLPPPPIPDIDLFDPDTQKGIADAIDRGIVDSERANSLDKALAGTPERKAFTLTLLAALLAVVAYVLLRWRVVFARFRRLFRPLPKDPAMLGPDVPVGSIGHRRLEVLRSADYGPVVRQFLLKLFRDRGLAGEPASNTLPPVEIDVRNPQFLRDALQTLWAELRGTTPVGYGRWRQLEPLIAAVRAAADDNKWRFVTPSRDAE